MPDMLQEHESLQINELSDDPNDDEMFLNDDEAVELKRDKIRKRRLLANTTTTTTTAGGTLGVRSSENVHIIYKRAVQDHHHLTDFGE